MKRKKPLECPSNGGGGVKKRKCERKASRGGERDPTGAWGRQEGQWLERWRNKTGTLTGEGAPGGPPLAGKASAPGGRRAVGDSPRTRFSGSLMLTVCSWEADRELLMERSAVGSSGGSLRQRSPTFKTPFPGDALTRQVWSVSPGKVPDPESHISVGDEREHLVSTARCQSVGYTQIRPHNPYIPTSWTKKPRFGFAE